MKLWPVLRGRSDVKRDDASPYGEIESPILELKFQEMVSLMRIERVVGKTSEGSCNL
jgi:hypothetical protein